MIVPSNDKTIKSKISKKLLSNGRDPPMKAKGTDEIRKGVKSLILILPALAIIKTIPRNDNDITTKSYNRKNLIRNIPN